MTSWQVGQVRKLLEEQKDKYRNNLEDMVEDLAPHGQPRNKKDDPSKKLKKEEILKFKKDFRQFKADHGIQESESVFYIENHYPFLKEEFLKRGWKENGDISSIYFDFKYVPAFKSIDLFSLFPGQLVNHCIGASSFTRKVGLCRNIRGSIWQCGADADTFFSRCYELRDSCGLFNFVQDFNGVQAYSKLKLLLQKDARISAYQTGDFCKLLETAVLATSVKKRAAAMGSFVKETESMEIEVGLLEVLEFEQGRQTPTSFLLNKTAIRNSILSQMGVQPKDDFIKDFLDRSRHQVTAEMVAVLYREVDTSEPGGERGGRLREPPPAAGHRRREQHVDREAVGAVSRERHPHIDQPDGHPALRLIERLRVRGAEVPGERAAGRQAEGRLGSKQFDIRQLAVIAGFEPFEVYLYDEFYVRLCANDFDSQAVESDQFASLANNSVSKLSATPKIHHENMMFMHEFDEHLKVPPAHARLARTAARLSACSKSRSRAS